MKTAFASSFALVAVLAACGSESSSSSTSSFKCCVNGAYYDCTTQEAMSHCAANDMAQFCPRKASDDAKCDD